MKSFLLAAAALAALSAAGAALAQVPPPPGVAQGTTPVAPPRPPIIVAPGVAPVAPGTRFTVMSNEVMTRDQVLAHVRRLFTRLDTNHDGFVTRDEMNSMHQHMMGMRGDLEKRLGDHGMMRTDRAAAFDRLDTNHDGMVSRQEFMAAQPQVREERVFVVRSGGAAATGPGMMAMPGTMRMHEMGAGMGMAFGGHIFDMADANHDGRVSLQEAESAALAHFDRADLNHDGKLTPEERSRAHQMMHRHPA